MLIIGSLGDQQICCMCSMSLRRMDVIIFQGFLGSHLRWIDLGWKPGAHQATLSLPSSAGQREKNMSECSWVKIRTGRSLSNYCHGQNRL